MKVTIFSTGEVIDLMNLKDGDIRIEDIAHALSMQCRYNGHCREFYSVAQHSVLVANYVRGFGGSKHAALAALLHDAHEAYMGDIIGPIKSWAPLERGLALLEKRLDRAIEKAFGVVVTAERRELIKVADRVLLVTEARDLLTGDQSHWLPDAHRLGFEIHGVPPHEAYSDFMSLFNELSDGGEALRV